MIDAPEIFDCKQGTAEWFAARLGIPTASNFSAVLAKGEGKTRRAYLLKLAGEAITGECVESFGNMHTERGHAMEPDARSLYAFAHDVEPQLVGFMRRGRAGASPDSLVGDNGLLEIKTKLPHLQLDVLDKGKLPSEHVAQVQGQLWISGREWLDFVSYWPRLPLFCVRVERDEKYIENLSQAVADFVGELDTYIERFGVKAA
ncbi:exonuclease [Rhodanobacter glycinis]|uniref:lambda exonuclease family protein n=1 Tax=Rhodanobacter glycinis TaxID=582702 RepID=UPI0011272793|nr:lambda exonuclease family protein [Rhodanobacter glycinis]TPG50154.1 exonuclease [Rhodanobacter glycinis]